MGKSNLSKKTFDFKNKLNEVLNEMDCYIKNNNIIPIYKGMFKNKANNTYNILTMQGTNDFCLKKGDPSIVILNFKDFKNNNSINSNQYFLYNNFLEFDPELHIFAKFLSSQNFNKNQKLKKNKQTGYKFWKSMSLFYSAFFILFIIAGAYALLRY